MRKFATKIWVLIIAYLMLTIAFMYIFADFLYEKFYVEDTKSEMIEIGENLQSKYSGGKVTDEYVELVESFNYYSNYDVFAVRNPRELSACVPFEIDYKTLIGPDERRVLLNGENITKIGYEERFKREVVSVILPLVDQNRLEGIIYIYYPLAKITELARTEVAIFIGGGVLFSFLIAILVYQSLKRIMRPLNDLHRAVEQMTEGDYSARVEVASKDEIGLLSEAFNHMAESIQREDEKQKAFLATVSHELRTPISYIKGYSEAIQSQLVEGKEQTEALELIHREAIRMERLTNELLQLVRKEKEEIEMLPIVLSETIRESVKLLEGQGDKKHIHIVQNLDENIIVLGDEKKLKQIFINIIENAIRYSDENAKVTINSYVSDRRAVIEIQDEGIGIPEEDLPHITERFYRVNKARSRSDGGAGLGLSIVKQLVKMHNGTLSIKSAVGEGTQVTITLPIMEEE
ncbi:HAMP domain-containing sensor histidine kinase [Ureibacillus sp. FSL K6-8385]|uniref:histidine kinase n=1 Tax=Ureibacillus terrenus TaxID=118246 RepID=A0A540V1V8_9BACL|nr:HAMP domain-containing sensor histidine kinase [Ureibacillus terrenus]MED3661041.1 HAMP domain-containing sensor histidine kinase [Ureibacillus terrenus]MED3763327.1 HAMP domain-containing sensor histidine kinase [Ureibacillus terrenus]TQE90742.1 HAMP domain-containing histidine kinase [Ureibacillus terrenus]